MKYASIIVIKWKMKLQGVKRQEKEKVMKIANSFLQAVGLFIPSSRLLGNSLPSVQRCYVNSVSSLIFTFHLKLTSCDFFPSYFTKS